MQKVDKENDDTKAADTNGEGTNKKKRTSTKARPSKPDNESPSRNPASPAKKKAKKVGDVKSTKVSAVKGIVKEINCKQSAVFSERSTEKASPPPPSSS
jgi:hypothetical protein